MRRLGKVVVRKEWESYACELLDEEGEAEGYAVFSSVGSLVRDCETLQEAEEFLTKSDKGKVPETASEAGSQLH